MQVSEKDHWEKIFTSAESSNFSWFQEYPKTTISFLESLCLPLQAQIIDIGGGDSNLAYVLLEKGFQNISVLDISANALKRTQKRLGEKANHINWIVSDIHDFKPAVKFDFWHDRAAFHFQTSEERISNYVRLAENSINTNGYMLLGTFSENGPEKCSGMAIKQYSEKSLSDLFRNVFKCIKCIHEDHQTPAKTTQQFLYCIFQKK